MKTYPHTSDNTTGKQSHRSLLKRTHLTTKRLTKAYSTPRCIPLKASRWAVPVWRKASRSWRKSISLRPISKEDVSLKGASATPAACNRRFNACEHRIATGRTPSNRRGAEDVEMPTRNNPAITHSNNTTHSRRKRQRSVQGTHTTNRPHTHKRDGRTGSKRPKAMPKTKAKEAPSKGKRMVVTEQPAVCKPRPDGAH